MDGGRVVVGQEKPAGHEIHTWKIRTQSQYHVHVLVYMQSQIGRRLDYEFHTVCPGSAYDPVEHGTGTSSAVLGQRWPAGQTSQDVALPDENVP